jgi:colicin import membrane protein
MTAPTLTPQAQPPQDDPFRYGWRWIKRPQPDGTEEFEQVPLTLEDLLHPEEDDFIVQTSDHQDWCRYLADVFAARVAADPTAVVLFDVRVAWDVPGLRAHGPDVAVYFGVRERKNWSTFDVATEGTRPALIVEVTSPSTVANDLAIKLVHYARAGVPFYVIVDTVGTEGTAGPRLLGYRLVEGRYQPLPLDERGWLWLEPVRVWLGVADGAPVCYDEAGRPLGDYTAVTAALESAQERVADAEARAAEEAAARTEAEARLQEALAELRRLRGES